MADNQIVRILDSPPSAPLLVYVAGMDNEPDHGYEIGLSKLGFTGEIVQFIWDNQCGSSIPEIIQNYIPLVVRAEEAGRHLGEILASQSFASRDIYLIGYSMGTRVIGRALLELNFQMKTLGWNQIQQVLFFNGAAPCHPDFNYRNTSIFQTKHGIWNFYNMLDPVLCKLTALCVILYAEPVVTKKPQFLIRDLFEDKLSIPIGIAASSSFERNFDLSGAQGMSHYINPIHRFCNFNGSNFLSINDVKESFISLSTPEQVINDITLALSEDLEPDPAQYKLPLSGQDMHLLWQYVAQRPILKGWLRTKDLLDKEANKTKELLDEF